MGLFGKLHRAEVEEGLVYLNKMEISVIFKEILLFSSPNLLINIPGH